MTIRTTLIASSLIAASLVSGAAQATLMGRDLNGSVGSFEAYYGPGVMPESVACFYEPISGS